MVHLEVGLLGEDFTSPEPKSLQDGATCWPFRLKSPEV